LSLAESRGLHKGGWQKGNNAAVPHGAGGRSSGDGMLLTIVVVAVLSCSSRRASWTTRSWHSGYVD
jgi:hypothetical protein